MNTPKTAGPAIPKPTLEESGYKAGAAGSFDKNGKWVPITTNTAVKPTLEESGYKAGAAGSFDKNGKWVPITTNTAAAAGPAIPRPGKNKAASATESAVKDEPSGGANANNVDGGKSGESASRTKAKTKARADSAWAPTRPNSPVAGNTNSKDEQNTDAQQNANIIPLTVNVDTSTLTGIAAASAQGVTSQNSSAPSGLNPADLVTARATLAAKAFIDNGFAKEDVDKAIKGMAIDQLNEAIDSSFAPAAGAFGNDKKGNAYGAHEVKSVVIAPNNRSEFGQTQTGVKTPDGVNSWASQGLLKADMNVEDFEKAGMYTNEANGNMGAIATGIVKITEASTNRSPFAMQANADNLNNDNNEIVKSSINHNINRNSVDFKYDSATNSTLVVDRQDVSQNNYTGNVYKGSQLAQAAKFERPIDYRTNGTINSEQFDKSDGSFDWDAKHAAQAADIKAGGTGDVDLISKGNKGYNNDGLVANNIPVPVITQAADGGYTAAPAAAQTMQISNTTQAAIDKYIAVANPNGGSSSAETPDQYQARTAMMNQIAESDPAGFGGMMSGIP
jgi:hypothetical protein